MVKEVFVFGSNKAGRHGKGAAHHALKYHGAIYGLGYGAQGDSYAIPTKDAHFQTLTLGEISGYIKGFIGFALAHGHQRFKITRIGCGLAGYTWDQVYPLFPETLPENCEFITEDYCNGKH